MVVVFIADCLTTQSAGIHVYAKQFIARVIEHYPEHNYYHITTESYAIEGSQNEIISVRERMPGDYRLRYFYRIPQFINSIKANVAIEMAHFGPFNLPSYTKRITVVHDLTPILFPQYHDTASVWWHKFFFGRLLRSVDALISNSQTTKDDIVNHLRVDSSKIQVCYPRLQSSSSLSLKEKREGSKLTILTVGTIEPRKNHVLILEALSEWYSKSKMDFTWIVAGAKGWKNQEFIKNLNRSPIKNKVQLKGFVDDVELDDLYRNSDIFIFASHYEGFGLPIIEAMSYGLNLYLFDTPIHREVGGDTCEYFSNAKELCLKIEDFNPINSDKHSVQLGTLNSMKFTIPFLREGRK